MNTLSDVYRRDAAEHGKRMAQADADETNESYDRLHRVFLSLVAAGKADDLFQFYEDPNPCVQCWAVAHTPEFDEARALAKLAQLERAGIRHVSMDAEYIIKEWKLGALRFLRRVNGPR